jgi:hypothetical protein
MSGTREEDVHAIGLRSCLYLLPELRDFLADLIATFDDSISSRTLAHIVLITFVA